MTPPDWTSFSASTLRLSPDQHSRYLAWLEGYGLIQELLPELSDTDREILMSGINEAAFDETFRGEDE